MTFYVRINGYWGDTLPFGALVRGPSAETRLACARHDGGLLSRRTCFTPVIYVLDLAWYIPVVYIQYYYDVCYLATAALLHRGILWICAILICVG